MKFKLNRNQWVSLGLVTALSTVIIVPAVVLGTREFSTPFVMVYHDTELHDNSFNQQAYDAATKFADDYDESAGFYDVDPLNESMVSSNTDQYFANGTEIVVANTFNLIPWLESYESSLGPNEYVIITDDGDHVFMDDPETEEVEHPNILSLPFAAHEASFLAGIISSIYVVDTWSDSPEEWKIGAWGALPTTPIINILSGFEYGVNFFFDYIIADQYDPVQGEGEDNGVFLQANPEKGWWSGSFNQDASSEEFTYEALRNGMKVVFPVAGGQSTTAINIIGTPEYDEIKVVGVDVDANKVYPPEQAETVLTTSVKNVEKAIYDALVTYYTQGWEATKAQEQELGLDGNYVGVTNTTGDNDATNAWESLIEKGMVDEEYAVYSTLDELIDHLTISVIDGTIEVESYSSTFL